SDCVYLERLQATKLLYVRQLLATGRFQLALQYCESLANMLVAAHSAAPSLAPTCGYVPPKQRHCDPGCARALETSFGFSSGGICVSSFVSPLLKFSFLFNLLSQA